MNSLEKVTYREANSKDVGAIARLYHAMVSRENGTPLPEKINFEWWKERLGDPAAWTVLAVENGVVVGCAVSFPGPDREGKNSRLPGHTIRVHAYDAKFEGTELPLELLRHGIRRAQRAHMTWLEAWVLDDLPAESDLLREAGFRKTGEAIEIEGHPKYRYFLDIARTVAHGQVPNHTGSVSGNAPGRSLI